jgi:hypothetical protein
MTSPQPAARRGHPQGGPPLLAPALAYGALTVAAAVLFATVPHPSASAASVLAYDRAHHTALQVAGFLIAGASVQLAIWTATVYRRLRTLGVTAPGAVIALAGGLLAAASLSLSGLISWTSSQVSAAAGPGLARALAELSFATGGPGFVVPFALLLAGVCVPALILGLTPRPWAWFGLAVAVAAVLSTFTLLTGTLDVLLPIGRFGGLVWLTGTSVLLPHDRRALRGAPAAGPVPGAAPPVEPTSRAII